MKSEALIIDQVGHSLSSHEESGLKSPEALLESGIIRLSSHEESGLKSAWYQWAEDNGRLSSHEESGLKFYCLKFMIVKLLSLLA